MKKWIKGVGVISFLLLTLSRPVGAAVSLSVSSWSSRELGIDRGTIEHSYRINGFAVYHSAVGQDGIFCSAVGVKNGHDIHVLQTESTSPTFDPTMVEVQWSWDGVNYMPCPFRPGFGWEIDIPTEHQPPGVRGIIVRARNPRAGRERRGFHLLLFTITTGGSDITQVTSNRLPINFVAYNGDSTPEALLAWQGRMAGYIISGQLRPAGGIVPDFTPTTEDEQSSTVVSVPAKPEVPVVVPTARDNATDPQDEQDAQPEDQIQTEAAPAASALPVPQDPFTVTWFVEKGVEKCRVESRAQAWLVFHPLPGFQAPTSHEAGASEPGAMKLAPGATRVICLKGLRSFEVKASETGVSETFDCTRKTVQSNVTTTWQVVVDNDYGLGRPCQPPTINSVKGMFSHSHRLDQQGPVLTRPLFRKRTDDGRYGVMQMGGPTVGPMHYSSLHGYREGYTVADEPLVVERSPIRVTIRRRLLTNGQVAYQAMYAWRVIRALFCGNSFPTVGYTTVRIEVPQTTSLAEVWQKIETIRQQPVAQAVVPETITVATTTTPLAAILVYPGLVPVGISGSTSHEESWPVGTYYQLPSFTQHCCVQGGSVTLVKPGSRPNQPAPFSNPGSVVGQGNGTLPDALRPPTPNQPLELSGVEGPNNGDGAIAPSL